MARIIRPDRGTSRRMGIALLLAATLLAPLLARPAAATFPGTNGKIAFGRGGDVWAMNPNGTGETMLTNGFDPAVSPDGSRIVYTNHNAGIWIMNADGSGQRALTDCDPGDRVPTWSPDGTRIAFNRDGEIWVINADGSGAVNLTGTRYFGEDNPAWSPLGNKIAFTRSFCDEAQQGFYCVFSMNADGSDLTNLTPELSSAECPDFRYQLKGNSHWPSWSPDGARIVFTGPPGCPASSGSGLWVMNADGSGKTKLTSDDGKRYWIPAFSPDGTKIAFQSDRDTSLGDTWLGFELYTVLADGSNITRLTNNRVNDWSADWGPAMNDPTPPTAPTLTLTEDEPDEHADGTTLFYNPAAGNWGVFTVGVDAVDAQSGVKQVAFPSLFGGNATVDTDRPFEQTYTWDETTASGARTVTATNNAELTSSRDFTVTPDTAGPSVAIGAPASSASIRNGQVVRATATDGPASPRSSSASARARPAPSPTAPRSARSIPPHRTRSPGPASPPMGNTRSSPAPPTGSATRPSPRRSPSPSPTTRRRRARRRCASSRRRTGPTRSSGGRPSTSGRRPGNRAPSPSPPPPPTPSRALPRSRSRWSSAATAAPTPSPRTSAPTPGPPAPPPPARSRSSPPTAPARPRAAPSGWCAT